MVLKNKGFICLVSIWFLLEIVCYCNASLKLSTTNPIAVGDNVTLFCTLDKELATAMIVKWTRNNMTVIDISVQNNTRDITVSNKTYGHDCDQQTDRKFCLTIPASSMTEEQHGSKWQCYIGAGPVSNVLRLNISVPVDNVMLTTAEGDTKKLVIEAGENVKFICTTGPSRPAVKKRDIQWITSNREIIGKSSITTTPSDGDKFITTANLTIQGHKGDEERDIVCSAKNTINRSHIPSNSIRLVVFWKPSDNATIIGYTTGTQLSEDSTLNLNCTVKGGKPLAVLSWSGICSRSTPINKSSSDISVSEIIMLVKRSYNGENCTCTATHPVKSYRSSQSVTFTVTYPPTLQVALQNTTENSSNVTIRCIGDGEPSNLTIASWIQTIAGAIIRTTADFDHVSEDKSVITFTKVRHEDSGLYTCKGTNGIPDRNNILEQSGSAYLDVKVSGKYNADPDKLKFYGTVGNNLSVTVPFYSNPRTEENQVSWFNTTSNMSMSSTPWSTSVSSPPLTPCDITFTLVEKVNITLTVFGKLVALQGQAAEMTIAKFNKYHRGSYSLTIKDEQNLTSSINVIITLSGPPESPNSFAMLSVSSYAIVLHWEKGFNGGHYQTFVVNLSETEHIKESVYLMEIGELESKSDYYITVKNLKPDTKYNITLHAYNKVGSSSSQSILAATSEVSTAISPATVAGVSSALVLIAIIGSGVLKRRRARNTGKNTDLTNVRYAVPLVDDPEDGMKPNIIYESAGPYFAAQSDNSAENNAFDDIVDVSAPDKERSAIYAVVNKAKKSTKNSGAVCCAETDENYENLEGGTNKVGGKCTVGLIENKPSQRKNKEGLVYVEVVVDNSDKSGGVIHGIENRNNYVDIDFSRRADPLPSDDEEDVAPCEPQE